MRPVELRLETELLFFSEGMGISRATMGGWVSFGRWMDGWMESASADFKRGKGGKSTPDEIPCAETERARGDRGGHRGLR